MVGKGKKVKEGGGRGAFVYIAAMTATSVVLIALNVLLGMRIPFTVHFLIGYVGSLLVFVVWHAVLTKGWQRSLLMFGLSFVVAFTAEALGVNFGLVFGRYYYTGHLGPQLFGVPFLAALAWEPIVYAAFCIADVVGAHEVGAYNCTPLHRTPRLRSCVLPSVVGALATTAWDMMIDPIAVNGGWWVWTDGGSYTPYIQGGVPVTNFLGWLGVAFVIQLLYRLIAPKPRRSSPGLSIHGPLALYSSLFLTAAGVSLTILRRPEVALVGLMAMGPFLAIAIARAAKPTNQPSNYPTRGAQ
jgi:putative membrane protein